MIRWESSFKPSNINKDEPKGGSSIGLGQVQLPTAFKYCNVKHITELIKVKVNLNCSAKYLRYQLDRYKGSYYKAISAYNAGTYYVRHTNRKHVMRILNYAEEIGIRYMNGSRLTSQPK